MTTSEKKASDINELERRARERDARSRMKELGTEHVPQANDAPGPSFDRGIGAGPLVLGANGGYALLGRPLRSGDVIELYTNRANGWIRGRFEWSGAGGERPRLAVNLWDPNGPRDEDGLPPWVGDAELGLPARAVCRWPEG